MGREVTEYSMRRPRYEAAGTAGFRIEVQRRDDPGSAPLAAELLDLSREGAKLRLPEPLGEERPIVVRVTECSSGLGLDIPATVRWQFAEPEGPAGWSTGCAFHEPLGWETLGELFLHGALTPE